MAFYQIDGIYFPNKGDELMFHAVNSEIKHKSTNNLLVYGNGKGPADPIILRNSGVFQLSHLQRFKIRFDKIFSERYLYRYGMISWKKINVILDSGGFQFGDQWDERYSLKKAKLFSKYYDNYKRNNCKIIFLPQALGPFNSNISKEIIKIVHDYADIVFARDIRSYDYTCKAVGNSEKIKQFPDFTNLLEPNELNIEIPNKLVVIIPNHKMITHTNKSISTNYYNFLLNLSKILIKEKYVLFFINHEHIEDNKLINQFIKDINNSNAHYIKNITARQIKYIIGKSKIVISSRYHGAISSLSQGVNTFCTSWSHKYEELLKEYNCPENILEVDNLSLSIDKILSSSIDMKVDEQKRIIDFHKSRSKNMWDIVFKISET